MKISHQNLFKTITFVLVLCLANVFTFASVLAKAGTENAAASTAPVMGILYADNAQSVFVNGNGAGNGTTVFSGAEIKTSTTEATINLNGLGEIKLSSNTTGKLIFAANSINLSLSNGSAQLTSLNGVEGTLITADGKILNTNAALEVSTVESANTETSDLPGNSAGRAPAGGLFGMGLLGTVAVIGGGALVAAMVVMGKRKGPKCDKIPRQAISKVKPCKQ